MKLHTKVYFNKVIIEYIVIHVAKEMGVTVERTDIEAAHHLPWTHTENLPATIIVQFAHWKKRDEMLAARKKVVTNSKVTGLSNKRIY